jgi:putative ABC transport system permease protein
LDRRRGHDGRGVVLTDGLWREAFAADPKVIGKTVYLNEEAFQVLGVAPATLWFPRGKQEFALPNTIDAFVPVRMANWEKTGTDAYFYRGIGRLAPGVTTAQAEEELTATMASIPWKSGIVHPTAVRVEPLQATTVRASRATLLLLFGAILSLLLIVCVNLANLSLVRWAKQSGELAVRVALGASNPAVGNDVFDGKPSARLCRNNLGLWLAACSSTSCGPSLTWRFPGWSSLRSMPR